MRERETTTDHPGLPECGPAKLEFLPRAWLRDLFGQISPVYFKVPRFGCRILLLPFRTRMANAETITWGPFMYTRPRPWLLGPARQLHPELFQPRRDADGC